MRVLIIGSAGLLGSYLYRLGKKEGADVIGLSRSASPYTDMQGDATDFEWLSRQVRKAKCGVVVNALKFKGSTDDCEKSQAECWKANFLIPERLAALQKELDFGLVQVSTDWVFDGSKGSPYTEEDVPYPRNFYAFSKYAAELAAGSCEKRMILRTTGLFGYENPARNFMARYLESVKADNLFDGAVDQISQPISALALSKIIIGLIKKDQWNGVFHATGPELVSRFELARGFARHFGYPKETVREATTAARAIFIPKQIAMDNGKLERALGRKVEGIAAMLKDISEFEKQ